MKERHDAKNLPQPEEDGGDYTDNVLIKENSGDYWTGYYDFRKSSWIVFVYRNEYYCDVLEIPTENVEAWWYLPE